MDAVAPVPRGPRPRTAPRGLIRFRSDAALAERFAAGDETAFSVLYERHRRSVLAVCIGVLGSRQDAEDAAQEAFAALATTLPKAPPRELRAWLVRVARNAAIDLARRRRVDPGGREMATAPDTAGHGISAELESVLAGLRELPEAQRTALLMRELAGHSYDEIATMLNTDHEAVRGLIARARIGVRNYRAALELPCSTAQAALAAEPDGRRHDRTVRRHVRGCGSCQAYRQALRADARALRALAPAPLGGVAGGGAVLGLAAKGALAGGALSQVGAVCAASICSVGAVVLLYPHPVAHHPRLLAAPGAHAPAAAHRRTAARRGQRLSAVTPSTAVRTSSAHAVASVSSADRAPRAAAVAPRSGSSTRSSLIFSWRAASAGRANGTRRAGADDPARGGGSRGGGAGDGSFADTPTRGHGSASPSRGDGSGSGADGAGGNGADGQGAGGDTSASRGAGDRPDVGSGSAAASSVSDDGAQPGSGQATWHGPDQHDHPGSGQTAQSGSGASGGGPASPVGDVSSGSSGTGDTGSGSTAGDGSDVVSRSPSTVGN